MHKDQAEYAKISQFFTFHGILLCGIFIYAQDNGAMKDSNLKFYDDHAASFVKNTVSVDFSEIRGRFSQKLNPGAEILDFGCGSGRDTKAFLRQGFHVTAVDGSEKLCGIAFEYTGIPVQKMLFHELNETERYDGIWACASILHVPGASLPGILERMSKALKNDGIIYLSFKYGTFEGERDGRYFTDLTEDSFADLICKRDELSIEEEWISTDVRPGREEQKWLNIILRKTDIN